MPKYSDIEEAFDFVNSSSYGMNRAVFCKDTGKFLYQSEDCDSKQIDEADENIDWDDCCEIPHKNDLDLGRELVLEFVEANMPKKMNLVSNIFRHSGAYSNYKELLDSEGLLQAWYDFENSAVERALRQWCAENDISLGD